MPQLSERSPPNGPLPGLASILHPAWKASSRTCRGGPSTTAKAIQHCWTAIDIWYIMVPYDIWYDSNIRHYKTWYDVNSLDQLRTRHLRNPLDTMFRNDSTCTRLGFAQLRCESHSFPSLWQVCRCGTSISDAGFAEVFLERCFLRFWFSYFHIFLLFLRPSICHVCWLLHLRSTQIPHKFTVLPVFVPFPELCWSFTESTIFRYCVYQFPWRPWLADDGQMPCCCPLCVQEPYNKGLGVLAPWVPAHQGAVGMMYGRIMIWACCLV